MDQRRFQDTAEKGMNMLKAAFSGIAPGDVIAYNGYFHGQEVVVLGYQYQDGAHTNTKPLAILVDDQVFGNLLVDGESARFGDETGVPLPPKVI